MSEKLKQYDAVELRNCYHPKGWESGYWILAIESDGSCLISFPYEGDKGITQLSPASRHSQEELRKAEPVPKLKVAGGIYKADNFLQDYGAFIVRCFCRDEKIKVKKSNRQYYVPEIGYVSLVYQTRTYVCVCSWYGSVHYLPIDQLIKVEPAFTGLPS